MATSPMSEALQHLRRTMLQRDAALCSDAELLSSFLHQRNEAALAALIQRHGPMVWGVCRRILRNYHDAEDAFQATFLVLVRKARSIVPREMAANWLYGVACRTALKAKAIASKRKVREKQVADMPEPLAELRDTWNDLQGVLDEELSHLPDRYRSVVVLCDLQGKTRKEAAGQLAVPEGTVAGWLARARAMLARRLARRGVTLSGTALAALLAENASAGVPPAVLSAAIKSATLLAVGKAAAGGLSAGAVALSEGVLKTMLVTKLKIVTAMLLVVGILGAGLVVSGWNGPMQAAGSAPVKKQTGEKPVAGREVKPDDPLEDVRARMRIAEQQLTLVVDENLRKASDADARGRAAAVRLLNDTLSRVRNNPDVGETVRNELLGRLLAYRTKLTDADKKVVWTLDFRYKSPRLLRVDVPGQGRQTFWYLNYEVRNPTDEPHTFIPDFQLVTSDTVHHDTVLPKVHEAICQVEDPTRVLDLKHSVTIAKQPIAPQKRGAVKKGVWGVTTWKDVAPGVGNMTVFVGGLSNVWTSDGETVRRKVLKIAFKRVDGEMVLAGPAEWVYRTAKLHPAKDKPAKPPTVTLRKGKRELKFMGGLTTYCEGMTLAILGSCTVGREETKENWSKALKGDHLRIVYPDPRPVAISTDNGDEVLQVSEILVPTPGARMPDGILVRIGDKYRVFAKYWPREAMLFQKFLQEPR
jgi:RNA polymerase sigma factor (sigma-70 family)